MENADRFLLAVLAILHSSVHTTVMAATVATLCCNVQVGNGDQILSMHYLATWPSSPSGKAKEKKGL